MINGEKLSYHLNMIYLREWNELKVNDAVIDNRDWNWNLLNMLLPKESVNSLLRKMQGRIVWCGQKVKKGISMQKVLIWL